MSIQSDPGPRAIVFKRHLPFADNAGIKDRRGNPVNLTYHEGRYLSPFQPQYFEYSRNAEIRPDDTLVCGYVKTGCHWMWETLNILRKGKCQFSELGKSSAFLEFCGPELYNSLPSPRILNTHNRFDWLPEKVRTYKNKIVLTTRNPKDVAVSLYNHQINLPEVYNYYGKFPDWFELFLGGYVDCGEYIDYHLHWQQAMQENPDHPLLIIRYEDCIQDFPGQIRKMADFIESPLSEKQVKDIAEFLSFKAMKKHFIGRPSSKLIRKGEVGDWKSWLTPEQSAEIDSRSEKLKGTSFEPRFEL
ncbi:sulfotransferase family cytosolic 1b member 1 [Plakobranchus ocellatus]|uniref:Sulfotransferase family cytosolic 1b member 1 n=1 Tax=Plakobranchus ocellatus TaxID=259542 RepID=A0AAV4D2F2_9GAST|nr:sulfotransferase family cytosolic 1b member 1 [Plakobranchus ocellatus]